MRESSTKAIFLFLSVFVFIFFLTITRVFAGPDTPFDDPLYDPDKDVPIDGGASLLIAAGVAYGLKKINDKRKQNQTPEL